MDVSGSLPHRVAASIRSRPVVMASRYQRGGVTCPTMPQTDNLRVVRVLWAAARENDADALVSLTAHDVDWQPTAVAAPSLHGRQALHD